MSRLKLSACMGACLLGCAAQVDTDGQESAAASDVQKGIPVVIPGLIVLYASTECLTDFGCRDKAIKTMTAVGAAAQAAGNVDYARKFANFADRLLGWDQYSSQEQQRITDEFIAMLPPPLQMVKNSISSVVRAPSVLDNITFAPSDPDCFDRCMRRMFEAKLATYHDQQYAHEICWILCDSFIEEDFR